MFSLLMFLLNTHALKATTITVMTYNCNENMVTISFPLHQSREVPVQPPNIQLVPIHMLSAINMGLKGK